jgi:hypothetical protein
MSWPTEKTFKCDSCGKYKPMEQRWKYRVDPNTMEPTEQQCSECSPRDGVEDALDMIKRSKKDDD